MQIYMNLRDWLATISIRSLLLRSIQITGFVLVALHFRHALNPDAISYMQVAQHGLNGNWELAVTGYWGPLFSWLLMPFIAAGIPAQTAARVLMVLSALFFLISSKKLLKNSSLNQPKQATILWSLWICALLWSVENITPDLLLAGIYLRIFNAIQTDSWLTSTGNASRTGLWLAAAYLAKSVALPVTLSFFAISILMRHFLFLRSPIKLNPQKCLALVIAWLLPVSLWVLTLSIHYQKPTFSTSAAIVHATVGPPDFQRYPLGFNIEAPQEGRITTWEDPTLQPEQFWSPFSSPDLFAHQISIILQNLFPVTIVTTSVFLFAIPTIFLITSLTLNKLSRYTPIPNHSWSYPSKMRAILAGGFTAVNVGVYMPTLLPPSEQRYFYALAPILALVLVENVKLEFARKRPLFYVGLIVVVGLVLPSMARWAILPPIERSAFEIAHKASLNLNSQEGFEPGPVVGNARMPRGRAGLFLAWYLKVPWYGGSPEATVDDYLNSGARILALTAGDPRINEVEAHPEIKPLATDPQNHLKLYLLPKTGNPANP